MAKQPPKKASVEKLTEQAQFVFRGTVVERGAATLDQIPLTRDTLVVTVDEILEGPPVLAGFAGQNITVQLNRGLRATVGQTYVFYTNGWIYGAGLAVKAVAAVPASDAGMKVARQALDSAPERRLRERASNAELVVTGRITEVRAAPRLPGAPITEHDPEWRQAVVAVDSVPRAATKSARKPKQVLIRFAASPDVRWADAPKFTVGDAGVWMLGDKSKSKRKETNELRAAAGAQTNEFLVVDPEDFLPAELSERVQSLLRR